MHSMLQIIIFKQQTKLIFIGIVERRNAEYGVYQIFSP
jgi:hypothetical protein